MSDKRRVELTDEQHPVLADYIEATKMLAAAQRHHDEAKQRFIEAQQAWQRTIL